MQRFRSSVGARAALACRFLIAGLIVGLPTGLGLIGPVGPVAAAGGDDRDTYRIASGYLDPEFGTRGSVRLPGGESIATGPNGSIWVLGSAVYTDGVTRYLTRLNSTGRPDRSFTGAQQTTNSDDLTTGPLVPAPGGGASYAINTCCRVRRPPVTGASVHTVSAAGVPLPGRAGASAWALTNLADQPAADADYVLGGVVRLASGRLRACVSVYPGDDRASFAALVGLRDDGSVDPAVGADDTSMPTPGWVQLPGVEDCGFAGAGLQQLFVDGHDRLYVVGTAAGVRPAATAVVRTNAAGVPDPGYGTAGVATVRSSRRRYEPRTGVVSPAGVLHLGLSSRDTTTGARPVATVVELSTSGRPDPRFGPRGVRRFHPAAGSSELDSLGFLPGGRLILGMVYTSGGRRTGRLTAVSATDGTRSVGFGRGGDVVSATLTWGTLVQGRYLLTIGSVVPADPRAYLGITVLQRRRL